VRPRILVNAAPPHDSQLLRRASGLYAKNPHEAQFLVRVTLLITNQCYLEEGSWRQMPP